MPERSPLAPDRFPALPPIAGVRLAAGACGIRYKGRTDLLFVELAPGTTAAGVFTRSSMPSAPVDWCRKAVGSGRARAIVVNSGNANAFTGRIGAASVARTVAATAHLVRCEQREVFVSSTGVIGEPLADERITAALPQLRRSLSAEGWAEAAAAIMTTDTFAKAATRTAKIGGKRVVINGIAKGSGMIAPNMGTMLAFIFTDARIPAAALRTLLRSANDRSFNSITVDGDTSTSDTVLLCATGQAGNKAVASAASAQLRDFRAKLDEVMQDLAQQVVRDGEGAQKLIRVTTKGAVSEASARRIALAIANSPLVKTAIAGEDANWGRLVMAVGKSGERAVPARLGVRIGGVEVARKGMRVTGYDEAPVNAHMKGREIDLEVDIGLGRGRATVWTCDLTHGYISINADYRS
ncbi:MAG: bifunctional glutamate N-acetyltransferase/amino-acid acetyltransferase ArgJ [Alphaproteobacteria bacterium]